MNPSIRIAELVPLLQTAIGPVILVSGVGLLLLSMTNRLGRVIDRSRALWREMKDVPPAERGPIHEQLRILSQRAGMLKRAITLAAISVLFAAVLVIVLFLTALFRLEIAWAVAGLFSICMLTLIGAMIEFIRDLNHSLMALELELRP